MPDESGRIRGIAVPAEAWERVFGPRAVEPCAAPLCPGRHECEGGGGKGEPCYVMTTELGEMLP